MYNSFTGIGRLTAAPESRGSDTSVTTFTVACDHGWGDNKKTEFMNCVAFGKLADIIADYGEKGKLVMVEGAIQTDKHNDKYYTKLICNTFKMLSPKGEGGSPENGSPF